MNDYELIRNLAVSIIPLIFALSFHEAAQAFVAHKLGDRTAYMQGRLTFNPTKHLDIWGSLVIPIIVYLGSKGTFWFGYAKPIPIDSRNFKNYQRDACLTICAGLMANLAMAFMWGAVIVALYYLKINETFFLYMAAIGIRINLSLFAINLIPLLPLDGGKIALLFTPYKYTHYLINLERYSFFIIMGLSILGVLTKYWILPIMNFFNNIIMILIRMCGVFLI
ncbi:MAG: hypothetical protein RLZZ210_902 [Pseudomonadota bacterium]|jgi:Zn-dependent protease